jgi:hypothetical protein
MKRETGERKKKKSTAILYFLEDTRVLRHTHAEQLFRPPVLVENVIGILPEFLHVSPYEHLAKLDKVAMVFVVNLDDTPRIGPPADMMAARRHDDPIGTDHSKRNFTRNFLRFCYGLFILVLVGRCLENVDVVIGYIRKNLGQK